MRLAYLVLPLLLFALAACGDEDIESLLVNGQLPKVPDCTVSSSPGDSCVGGIVFNMNYQAAGIILIAATADSGSPQWKGSTSVTSGAQDSSDGRNNTGTWNPGHPAAFACVNKFDGGYTNWFLPSRNELTSLSGNQAQMGNMSPFIYWSSTEAASPTTDVFTSDFAIGSPTQTLKTGTAIVRCIRRIG